MKSVKTVCLICAVFLLLSACGTKTPDIDAEAAADAIMHGVAFDEVPESVSTDVAKLLFDLEDADIKNAYIYESSGATADELAVFEAADGTAAEKIKAALNKRIETQKKGFENYLPKEMPKLQTPVIEQSGNVLVLCVCADNNAARAIIKEALGL